MKKYKIDNYIVKADSIRDAVTIVKTINNSVKDSRRINYDDDIIEVTLNGKVVFRGYAEDRLDDNFDPNFKWTGSHSAASNTKGKWVVRVIDSFRDARTISPWALSRGKRILSEDGDKATVVSVKDAELHSIKFEGARIEYAESNHNTSGVDTWTTPDKINKWLERENLSAYEKYKKRGGGYDKIHIDFKYLIDGKHYAFHALRVDIGESSKFHKIENGDIDYVTQVIKKNFKHSGTLPQGLKRLDSVKDSVTVREVIESLVTEETSAIASYNVALETLKDHIPAEAYEAIKAIRDDEQRHVENLYAVLNGNVTPKNLEN